MSWIAYSMFESTFSGFSDLQPGNGDNNITQTLSYRSCASVKQIPNQIIKPNTYPYSFHVTSHNHQNHTLKNVALALKEKVIQAKEATYTQSHHRLIKQPIFQTVNGASISIKIR